MLRNFFRKRPTQEEIAEEFGSHIETETRLWQERGLSRTQAEMRAHQSFGNKTRMAEDLRQAWGWGWLDRLMQDLRYAARSLLRSPAFTIAAVLSLALGTGAGTAVFSIADTVFLRPLPYSHPEQLMWVANRFPGMNMEFLASPDYVAWRRGNGVFQQLAATQAHGGETMLLNGSNPAEVHAVRVSSNFLATFGIRPALGRDFAQDEELPNGPKAILLSNRLWRQRFGEKTDIAGQRLTLDGEAYTIIGVLPASFVYPMDVRVDVMTTLPVSPTASHHDIFMATWAVYGRLKAGVTLGQAQADLQRLFTRSKADIPLMFRSDTRLVVQPLQEHRVGDAPVVLSILIGAVSCLLLIACVNVSNLMLGQWAAKSGELGVRAAIGAGRGRLTKQLFTEAALLAVIGCALSTLLVFVILRGFVHYAGDELPRLSEVTLDARVFGIGMFVTILATLVSSMLPLLRAGRVDIQQVLQESRRFGVTGGFRFAKRALVVAEVAISVVLLFGAALLLETLWHLKNDHLGFEPEHVLTVTIPLRGTKLENRNRDQLVSELVGLARRIPGTEDAAQGECTPVSAGPLSMTFSRSDRPLPEAFHRGNGIHACGAGAGFARAAGLRLVRGRFFMDSDSAHPNTLAVINEAAAIAYFPGEDPLGKEIIGGPKHEWKKVIGMVADTKNAGLDAKTEPQAFVNELAYPGAPDVQLIVRSIGDERAIKSALAQGFRSLDAGLALDVKSLDETIGEMTTGPRFNGMLLASFAAIAVLMAAIGVYGLLSFAVTQRTHEIGIRMALGAERGRILVLVLKEGTTLVAVGLVAGTGGVFALTRYLKAILYGVGATDPVTFLMVCLGVLTATLLAMFLPAGRAATVEPMTALRHS